MSQFNTKDTYKESFEDYCKNNDLLDLLNLWDFELNNEVPSKVAAHCSRTKFWFKCPRGIHGSHLISLNNLCRSVDVAKKMDVCPSCKSIGQFIIDKYGKEYLYNIWSNKNDSSYFEISRGSHKRIWLKCLNDDTHPDYDLMCSNFEKSHNCPYCSGKRVCYTNSLGYKFPKVLSKWSDKNILSPFDYTPFSKKKAWFKCENSKHPDYYRFIYNESGQFNFVCPECGKENQHVRRGEEHPNWKGGITPIVKKIRKSKDYSDWRNSVYKYDDYMCQCCLKRGNNNLRAHHILSFSDHEDLRFELSNGITMCENCHDPIKNESFHNVYGTHNASPQQLEEFINKKRKQLGIIVPFNIENYIRTKNTTKFNNWINFINSDPEYEELEEPLDKEE